jgi:hypothetical protein
MPNSIVVICVASLAVALDLLRRGGWRGRAWTARLLVLRLLVLLWILPSLAMPYATVAFEVCKRGVLQNRRAPRSSGRISSSATRPFRRSRVSPTRG